MVKDVWWDNVIFREFAAHFISMSDEQVVRDIRESVVKVINLDESGDSFGANMVRRAKERLCGRHDIAVQNGSKGGRPKKSEPAADEIGDAIGGLAADLCAGVNDSSRVKSAHAGSHKTGKAPARTSGRRFANKEEFIQWAIDAGLDPLDAGECWDATLERGGKDADGNKVNNIKAFATQWCKTRASNREEA